MLRGSAGYLVKLGNHSILLLGKGLVLGSVCYETRLFLAHRSLRLCLQNLKGIL
ncbi:hypothetical protein LINPERPRIM_LOCUS15090 [Linum perenne]